MRLQLHASRSLLSVVVTHRQCTILFSLFFVGANAGHDGLSPAPDLRDDYQDVEDMLREVYPPEVDGLGLDPLGLGGAFSGGPGAALPHPHILVRCCMGRGGMMWARGSPRTVMRL